MSQLISQLIVLIKSQRAQTSNPLDSFWQHCNESLIMNNTVFDIAHGEDKETKITFPSPFPNDKFDCSCIHKTKLSWSK